MRRRWQSRPPLLAGNQGGKALKWLPAHFNFYGSVSTSSGHFGAVDKRLFWKKALIFLPGLCRFYGRNGFFLNFFQDGFFRKPLCQQVHFVPKSGVGRGMGVFIYALSADETSLALAAPRHAITALFSCRFKSPCPPRRQRHFYGNADRAYNTLHFASKVVCQGASPFGNPRQQNRLNISHFPGAWYSAFICCQQPVSRSACSSL